MQPSSSTDRPTRRPDTISLGATSALDLQGSPHSDQLHVIQRFHRVAYDTMEDQLTYIDPKALTAAVTDTAVFKYHPDWELEEFECANERLNLSGDSQGISGSRAKPP